MDELTSTEFRKRYAKLTEPTVVTVNGHAIGVWRPGETSWARMLDGARREEPAPVAVASMQGAEVVSEVRMAYDGAKPVVTSQAKRDDLLRKINKPR